MINNQIFIYVIIYCDHVEIVSVEAVTHEDADTLMIKSDYPNWFRFVGIIGDKKIQTIGNITI